MILAIDPSLTATGLVRGTFKGVFETAVYGSENKGDSAAARVVRYRGQISRMMEWIATTPVEGIFIEGYSMGSNDARAKYSAEFGGLLRAALFDFCPAIWEIPPTMLKRFAAGKGNADKAQMMARVQMRWRVKLNTHDQCDAFALYRLGLMAMGHAEPMDLPQAEVLEVLKNRKAAKPKARSGGSRKPVDPTLF